MRRKVNIEFSIDQDGKDVVLVPLSNVQKVVLYETDLDLLMELGCTPRFSSHLGIVKFRPLRGFDISIARLLLDAGNKQKVLYLNNNKLDLRRTNLVLAKGRGTRNERKELARYLRHTGNK
jgi:hypothetical protein